MGDLKYEIGCRNCITSDGFKHIIEINDTQEGAFRYYPEFEVVRFIENYRILNKDNFVNPNYIYCNNCGSDNIEIYDPEINGNKIFNLELLDLKTNLNRGDLVTISIRKTSGISSLTHAVTKSFHEITSTDYYIKCYDKIVSLINNLPNNYFIENSKGDTYFCLTVGPEMSSKEIKAQVEKFYSYGLSRTEIIKHVEKYYKQTYNLF